MTFTKPNRSPATFTRNRVEPAPLAEQRGVGLEPFRPADPSDLRDERIQVGDDRTAVELGGQLLFSPQVEEGQLRRRVGVALEGPGGVVDQLRVGERLKIYLN